MAIEQNVEINHQTSIPGSNIDISQSPEYRAVLLDLLVQLAALPPWAQEMREEAEIISLLKEKGEYDERVVIKRTEQGYYSVETLDHVYTVHVIYESRDDGIVGPAKFHLELVQNP